MRKIEEKSQLAKSKRNSCRKLPPKRNTLQHVPCPTTPKELYQNKNVSEFKTHATKNEKSDRPKRKSSKSGETPSKSVKSVKPVLKPQNSEKSQGYQSLDQADESTSTYLSPSGSNENHSFNNYCKTIQYEQLNSKYSTRIYPVASNTGTINSATLHQYHHNYSQRHPNTILSNTKSYEAVFTFNQSTLI